MAYAVFIGPEAFDDIQQAIDYYNQIQPGLGSKFLSHLHSRIKTIYSHPKLAVRYDNIRVLVLKKFPYAIHYFVDDDLLEVNIIALRHQAENPDKLKKPLGP